MSRRAYTNKDGTIRAEILAEREAVRAAEVRARGIDEDYVESLLECVNEDGYVILPNLITQETIDAIRRESEPFLKYDGQNYSLAISRERARQCSEKIQSLLGYSMLFPFIGFVDGRDPIRLLQDRPRAAAAREPAPASAGKEGTRT